MGSNELFRRFPFADHTLGEKIPTCNVDSSATELESTQQTVSTSSKFVTLIVTHGMSKMI